MPVPATSGSFQTNILSMSVGDYIACKYTAASGATGFFNNLGASLATAQANEIPVVGTATPSGYFYFIKVDSGKLIADRVIQTTISWDTLNTNQYTQGNNFGDISLLHFDGNLLDVSGKVWGNAGGVASSAQSKFGGSSLYLNGSSYIACESTDYIFGLNDFSIDFWIYVPSTVTLSLGMSPVSIGASNICIDPFAIRSSTGIVVSYVGGSAGSWSIASNVAFTTIVRNTWLHWYFGRSGNTFYTAENGVIKSTFSSTDSVYNPNNVYGNDILVGVSYTDGTYYFPGYIDELRVSKGFARWIANFTPPTAAGTLNSQSIHLPSGGAAYLSAAGTASSTDQSLGAWPSTNEYDKYIVKNNLNGKIIANDNNVWHNSSIYSICSDTIITGIGTSNRRVARESSTLLSYPVSSSTASTLGFRPIMRFIDPTNTGSTNIWY